MAGATDKADKNNPPETYVNRIERELQDLRSKFSNNWKWGAVVLLTSFGVMGYYVLPVATKIISTPALTGKRDESREQPVAAKSAPKAAPEVQTGSQVTRIRQPIQSQDDKSKNHRRPWPMELRLEHGRWHYVRELKTSVLARFDTLEGSRYVSLSLSPHGSTQKTLTAYNAGASERLPTQLGDFFVHIASVDHERKRVDLVFTR